LLPLLQAALTKTAPDNNKKSENTPPQTSKQATNEPRESGASFFSNPNGTGAVYKAGLTRPRVTAMKFISFLVVALVVFVAWAGSPVSLAADGSNLTSVNGAVEASPGTTYDTVSTVNGQVRLGRGAIANEAKTVNGQLVVEDDVKLGSASTVNGSLRIGEGANIDREASTVNGSVSIGNRSRVGGNVSTVSGEIELRGAEVGGSLTTRNGDVDLQDGARVRGGIHIKEKSSGSDWGWGKDKPIRVHICSTCVVEGELRFDRPVELRIDDGAKIGKVIGDDVKRR
jgi:predicted acyltransferase (DUF342 family)